MQTDGREGEGGRRGRGGGREREREEDATLYDITACPTCVGHSCKGTREIVRVIKTLPADKEKEFHQLNLSTARHACVWVEEDDSI